MGFVGFESTSTRGQSREECCVSYSTQGAPTSSAPPLGTRSGSAPDASVFPTRELVTEHAAISDAACQSISLRGRGTGSNVANPVACLTFPSGLGLIDTRAQHGVMGLSDYNKLGPREFPSCLAGAKGVGGQAAFVKNAEVPVGIQGTCGVVTLHVVESELPFLLPMSFCKSLGMVLDTTNNTATWEKFKKVSNVGSLDTDHIAISFVEFPFGGRKNLTVTNAH